MSGLARRDRRALWLGGAVVLPVLAWRAVAAPLVTTVRDTQARLEMAVGLLAREQALVRDSAALGRALRAAQARAARAGAPLLAAADTVGAMAAVRAMLRGVAQEAGLEEAAVDAVVEPGDAGTVLVVDADVRARGTIEAVDGWLARLDGSARRPAVARLELVADDEAGVVLRARVRVPVRLGAP